MGNFLVTARGDSLISLDARTGKELSSYRISTSGGGIQCRFTRLGASHIGFYVSGIDPNDSYGTWANYTIIRVQE